MPKQPGKNAPEIPDEPKTQPEIPSFDGQAGPDKDVSREDPRDEPEEPAVPKPESPRSPNRPGR